MEHTVTAKGIYGFTVLAIAAVNGHAAVVRHLLENGADLNVKDSLGRSMASLAKKKEHWDIYEMLKRAAIDRPRKLRSIMRKLEVLPLALLDSGCSEPDLWRG